MYWLVPVHASHSAALVAGLERLKPKSALVFSCPNAMTSTVSIVEDLRSAGWIGAQSLSKELFIDSAHGYAGKARSSDERAEYSGEDRAWRSVDNYKRVQSVSRGDYSDRVANIRDIPVFVSSEESVRGLHLDAVEAVFILGLPKTGFSYIHMAGRTGRLPYKYGTSVLVAQNRELAKVINGFVGETHISDWKELGRGSPEIRFDRRLDAGSLSKKRLRQRQPRKDGRGESLADEFRQEEDSSWERSETAQDLDDALWR